MIKKQRKDAHVECGAKFIADRFKLKHPFFRTTMKTAYVKNGYDVRSWNQIFSLQAKC